MAEVVVVGAGRCGLEAARALAAAGADLTLVERLPAPGGQDPEPATSGALTSAARAAGVRFLLGTLAVRWDGEQLHALGVDGASRLRCTALVVATGTRPATRGELGIAGDRFAGVLPGAAALHLTESGVLLGHRPTVLGGGSLAARLVGTLRHAGASHVTVVAPTGILDPGAGDADSVLEGWVVEAAVGSPRVAAVTITRDGVHERLSTDALVLAHLRVPMHNIEGAVRPARRVTFCQATADPKSDADANAEAAHAVHAVRRAIEEGDS